LYPYSCWCAAKQYLDNIRAAEQDADGDDEDGAVAEQLRQDALEVRGNNSSRKQQVLLMSFSVQQA
jgi:hypothetical protein